MNGPGGGLSVHVLREVPDRLTSERAPRASTRRERHRLRLLALINILGSKVEAFRQTRLLREVHDSLEPAADSGERPGGGLAVHVLREVPDTG
jgi:hypothetical protein